jgi:hypothetical protein
MIQDQILGGGGRYEYLSQLEFIASQPFADKIAVKTTGILKGISGFVVSGDLESRARAAHHQAWQQERLGPGA